jgi:branched-chain amino acid transport system permease protein
MLYREAGQFKTTYAADQAVFPIRQDRYLIAAALLIAFIAVPLLGNEYWLLTIMIPFLVFSLAALGLNILTGYAGQVSLGTGGFMAVGAFATYKLATAFPDLNIVLVFLIAGVITALVGLLFGFPSLRIKGSTSPWRPWRHSSS